MSGGLPGELIAIYQSPRDYPGEFVARVWRYGAGTVEPGELVARGHTIDHVREQLPDQLYRVPRMPDDDPTIVECWI